MGETGAGAAHGGRAAGAAQPGSRSTRCALELEAFADAIEGRAPYPVTTAQMIDAVAAMEAINRSMESRQPVRSARATKDVEG